MRVAIYLRTDPDTPHPSLSHEEQEAGLRTHIQTRDGWHLVGQPYIDRACSAMPRRPGLRRTLTDAGSGRFDVLLVYTLDRLARSPGDLAQILNRLDHAGVALHSVTDPLDTPLGRLTLDLVRAFAEIESAAAATSARLG